MRLVLRADRGDDMEQDGLLDRRFQKLLVARFSPENKCFVSEGEILFAPLPKQGSELTHGTSQEFLSCADHQTSSKFGWVRVEPVEFRLEDFLDRCGQLVRTTEQIQVTFEMLNAVSKLGEGVPVAASYFSR